MKKLFFSLVSALIISLTGTAQVSESINYQAVARNNAGAALVNQTMKVRLTISRNAVTQYSETRQVTTNALGLFNVQIGSAGALSTTGTFNAIDWMNNTPNMLLKVELDINNSNVFTEMGFQAFSSVPFAFAAKNALVAENTENIAGRPLDIVTTPAVGSRLSWNGSNWTPVKKDTVYSINATEITTSLIANVSSWRFINSTSLFISVSGNERVIVNLNSAIANTNSSLRNNFEIALCYQLADLSGPVTPINSGSPQDITLMPAEGGVNYYSQVSGSGAITLPAGTYIFGLAIRNNANSIIITSRTFGTVEVKN